MSAKQILLEQVKIVLPDRTTRDEKVLIEDGKIRAVGRRVEQTDVSEAEIVRLNGDTLYAGFIDVHNHGAVGVDVNEANAESLQAVGRFLAANGVTAWLPTFV